MFIVYCLLLLLCCLSQIMFGYFEFQFCPLQIRLVGLFLHECNLFGGILVVLWTGDGDVAFGQCDGRPTPVPLT